MLSTTERQPARRPEAAAAVESTQLRARIDEILNRHPCVGLAVGVVRDGQLEFFDGRGVTDVRSKKPVTEDTVFRIASISKTMTAVAVMQLYEQGKIDLDAPANKYLRGFQLVPARPEWRPASVRHLLTHTSGLPEMVHPVRGIRYMFGESYRLEDTVPSLAEYYGPELRLVSEPGATFRYTDHSFSTLGQIVEDVSGQPYVEYMREHVFAPLGMADTGLDRARFESRRATGYRYGRLGPKPITDRQWLTAAAGMVYSTPRDMARYVAALLGGGANGHGRILRSETMAMMFEPHYQTHPLIPGIGIAFDRFNAAGQTVIGHEGILPGFTSQIMFAPAAGVGVMAFANGAVDGMLWLPFEVSRLLGLLIGAPEDAIRTDVPQHPERWAEICGWYAPSARIFDTRLRVLFGLGVEVFVRGDQLMVRVLNVIPALYRGFVLHPDDEGDPFVFRVDASAYGMGTARVVFGPDSTGTMNACLDVMPLSLKKQPDATNPRVWARRAAAVAAAGMMLRFTMAVVTRSSRTFSSMRFNATRARFKEAGSPVDL